MHLKGSQYGEPSQMATSSWWHLRWADWPNILVKRCNLKSDFKTTLRCHGPLCLASGSSVAMPATIPMEATHPDWAVSLVRGTMATTCRVLSWAMVLSYEKSHSRHSHHQINMLVTGHHQSSYHTQSYRGLDSLETKHRVIQVLPVVLSACLCTYTRYMHRIQNIRIVKYNCRIVFCS